jgi:hypothetical protein
MSRLIVSSFGLSIDGFGAGPHQSLANPLGVGGPALMEWAFTTRTFQHMHGGGGGSASRPPAPAHTPWLGGQLNACPTALTYSA